MKFKIHLQLLILLFAKIGLTQNNEISLPLYDTCYSYFNEIVFHSSNSNYYPLGIHQLPYNEWRFFQVLDNNILPFRYSIYEEENGGEPYVIITKVDTINKDTILSFFPHSASGFKEQKTNSNIKKELTYTYFFKSIGISNLLSQQDSNTIRIVYPTHLDRKNLDIIEFKVIDSDSIKVNFTSVYCKNIREYEILQKESSWLNKRSRKHFYKSIDLINIGEDSTCYECTEEFLESSEFFIEQNINGYSYDFICPYSELDTRQDSKRRKKYRNFLGFATHTRQIYFQKIPPEAIFHSP